MNVGILQQEQGDVEAAAASYERALTLLERAHDARLLAIALGNLGTLAQECGDPSAALVHHERSLAALRTVGDVRSEALALTRLTASLSALDRLDDAGSALERAGALVRGVADPVTRAAVALGQAFIDVARARASGDAEGGEASSRLVTRARQLMAAAHQPIMGGASPVELSDDIRIALRLLGAALAELHAGVAGGGDEDGLLLSAGGGRYRVPGGEWVDLTRHPVLRRVLAALVDHRYAAPGTGLSLDVLQQRAWPGERIRPDAAANRIYVAVSKLRRQGLRQWLLRNEDGYLLEPTLGVHRGA